MSSPKTRDTSLISELSKVSPIRPRKGVRLVRRDQMHLTLHYIGNAGVGRVSAALQAVEAPAFALAFEGLGRFPSAGGS